MEEKMKKILIGIASFCFLFFAKVVGNVQAAATDVSDNFVSLNVDKKRAWFNDDFVHVQAKFDDRRRSFTANSIMKITWENSRNAFLQGVKENKKLVIQDEAGKNHEVGQYVVDKDGVVVLFNDEVATFEDISGQIDFDLQVKNESEKSCNLIMQAGDLTKSLHIVGQTKPIKSIGLVKIAGDYAQDNVSWAIDIEPAKAEYAQIEVENIIPEGQILDEKSLKVKVADREIKLDRDNFQLDGNNLKLDLDGKKYQGLINISYNTKVKDLDTLSAVNRVAVRYQLNDDKTVNENIYGSKIQHEIVENISGKTIEKQTEENLTRRGKEKQEVEKINKEQTQNNDLKLASTPKVQNTDENFKNEENKIPDNDDSEDIEKESQHKVKENKDDLPKTGESISSIWSIAGLSILIMSALILVLKRKSR